MKIKTELDAFETEALFDILHHEIIEHTCLAKLKYLSGEITKSQLQWHTGHAKFLEKIKEKLLSEHTKATKKYRVKSNER